MRKEQTESANFILYLLKEQGKALNLDQLVHFADKSNINHINLSRAIDALINEKFLRYLGDAKYFVDLTIEGIKAADVGLEKYYELKETQEKQKYVTAHNLIIGNGTNTINTTNDHSLNRSLNSPRKNPDTKAQSTVTSNKILSWVKIISAIIGVIGAALGLLKLF